LRQNFGSAAAPLDGFPRLLTWAERITAIGHGRRSQMSAQQALLHNFKVRGKAANETTPLGIALLQRPAVFTGDSLIATAQALSLPCKCIQSSASACAAARAASGPSASVMLAPI